MKTPEEWLVERCYSLKGVTAATIKEIQDDAREYQPLSPPAEGWRDAKRFEWALKNHYQYRAICNVVSRAVRGPAEERLIREHIDKEMARDAAQELAVKAAFPEAQPQ